MHDRVYYYIKKENGNMLGIEFQKRCTLCSGSSHVEKKKTLSQWLPLGRVESVNKFTSVVVLD